MKPELVITAPLKPQPIMDALERDYTLWPLWEMEDRAAGLAAVADRVRGIATNGQNGASAELIDALPKLEIISSYGVGVDAIDRARAQARGVAVTNTPDVLNDDVADLTIALMLAAARRLCEGDRYVRNGQWLKGPMVLGHRVSGKRLGILGLGRIGQAIARRAEGFDMTISYHQRRRNPAVPYRYHDDLVAMARDSDFLAVIVPGGAATRHLVDRPVLDALGPEGVLINVARGSVVDETALVEALTDGRLGGAGLDVFENEPEVPEALFRMNNVTLQPHMGSATIETRTAMGRLVIDNLRAHFAGEPLLTPVN